MTEKINRLLTALKKEGTECVIILHCQHGIIITASNIDPKQADDLIEAAAQMIHENYLAQNN